MREGRLQLRQLGVHRLQFRFVRLRKLGPGAHKILIVTLDQPFRFRVETEFIAIVVKRLDAREQFSVEMNCVPMRGQLGRHFLLDLLQLRIGVRAGQVRENPFHSPEQFAGALQRHDCIFKRRLVFIVRDCLGFLEVIGHPFFEGRRIMLVLDPVERRRVIWQRAFGE